MGLIPEWKFRRWMAYYECEPWGEDRADLRSAIVACTIANSRPRKRGAKTYKPKDFMPFAEQGQTPEQQKTVLEGLTAMLTASATTKKPKK